MADFRATPAPEEPRRAAGRSVFRKAGDYWTIAYEGRAIRLKDAKGLHCLARLLRNPGREFHATDLVSIEGAETVGEEPVSSEQSVAADLGDAGEALDAQAKAEYRARLEELRDELEEAGRFNDTGRADKVRAEIEAITRELAAGVGLGGRDRPAASHAERARVMITQRLKSSLAKIRESHPSLGRHLATTVKTGYFCSYGPDPAQTISWDDSPGELYGVRDDDSRGGAPAEAAEPSSRQAHPGAERRLAAIFSADVEGYTRLMNEDEAATIRTLTAHRAQVTALIGERRGRVVDSPGDNVLAEFASAIDAVECAVRVQSALEAENAPLPPERRMEFRIGINVGDVVAEGDRIYGDGVNVAARVERLAEAGGICISGSVYDQVKNKLPLAYEDLGPKTLKNVSEPVRVYRVKARLADAPRATAVVRAAKRRRRSALAIAAILVLLVAALAARTMWFRVPVAPWDQPLTLPDKPSIAILPFTNLSGDPEQEYFTTGMTQDLIADASKLSGLFVIAHESVLPYKGKAVNVREVGRDLGVRFVLEGSVRYVLEGSVRKAGDQIRITVRLVDATNGRQVWAERYDRQFEDTFAVEDDILRHLIADLQVEVEGAELERIRLVPAQNLTAYESYLRGVDFAKQCTSTSVAQAREMFERAIDVEPNFAAAYAELGLLAVGEAYGPLAVEKLCASRMSPYRRSWWNDIVPVLKRRGELADRALALDASLPTAHVLRAFLEPGTPQAIAEVDRAIALGPGDARAHVLAAAIYSTVAKPEEAITLLEKALRLNPRYPDWYLFHLGRAYALTGRHQDAAAALKKVVLSSPDFPWAHMELAALYRKLDRQEEARVEEGEFRRVYEAAGSDSYPRFVADGDEFAGEEEEEGLAENFVKPSQERPDTLGAASAGVPLPSPTAKGSMDWFFRLK